MQISGIGFALGSIGGYVEQQKLLERMTGLDPNVATAKMLKADDADGDNLISAEETSLTEEQFKALDRDNDRSATVEELLAYHTEQIREKAQALSLDVDQTNLSSLVRAVVGGSGENTSLSEESGSQLISRLLGNIGISSQDITSILSLIVEQGVDFTV
jgi:hypothetical protein